MNFYVLFSDLVSNLLQPHIVWIGLNDMDVEGTFIWVDGVLSTQGESLVSYFKA